MTKTPKYGFNKPGGSDYAKIESLNENADLIETALEGLETGKEGLLKNTPAKSTPADTDSMTLVDSADGSKTKRVLWSAVKTTLKTWFDTLYAAVGHTHAWSTITGKPSSFVPDAHAATHKTGGADPLTPGDIGAEIAGSAATVQSNLTAHAGDTTKHITAAERTTWNGKEAALSGAVSKTSLVSADMMVITDSAASNATKRITWANVITAIKSALNTVYAAVSHTHAPTDLTAAVPLTKGGTGATTAATARAALEALAAFGPVSITISATWSGSGPWTQSIAVSGVLAAWDWRLGIKLAKITDDAARELQEKALNCITFAETYDGGITLTCRKKKPDVAISAILAGEV